MKTITQEYRIKAPAAKVWQALTDPRVIKDWGGGPAVMDDKEGTEFKLWGGDIYGKNVKVSPHKLLVQEWYDSNFKQPSEAKFELHEKDGGTILRLIHSNVADDRFQDIGNGWEDYYLGPLKELLES